MHLLSFYILPKMNVKHKEISRYSHREVIELPVNVWIFLINKVPTYLQKGPLYLFLNNIW